MRTLRGGVPGTGNQEEYGIGKQMIEKCMEYLISHGPGIAVQLRDHLIISLLALAAAIVIGMAGGYAASRSGRGERWIKGLFHVLRVIPSLAILVLLIPVMGTGVPPAVTALCILAVPPVLINTCAGFQSVPAFMLESAAGLGMTDREILRKVSFPQAMPMILSGIRSALVEVIASAALAAKIGAGGLGEIIFTGLGLNRADLLLIGGVLVAALSLLCCGIFDLICRGLMPYKYLERKTLT